MKKELVKYLMMIFLGSAVFFNSCSSSSDFEEDNETGDENIDEKDDQDQFVTTGFSLELGKSQKETAVQILSTKDEIYVVGHTEADYGEVSDFEDFKGGYYDLYVTKLNALGEIQWEKCFGTSLSEKAVEAHLAENGDLLILGNTSQISYGNGGLGHLVGSSDIMVWRINSEGEIVWQLEPANNNEDELIQSGIVVDKSLVIFYTEIYGKGIHCLKIDLTSGTILEKTKLEYDYYSVYINKVKRTEDGGFVLVGSANNNAAIIKLNASFQKEWACDHGGSGGENGYDIAETADGYLLVGSTSSSQLALGNNNLYPYYRIIHDPVTKGTEVYLLKVDKSGQFKCNSWTSGNGNNVKNVGWQIGFGYLESEWCQEYTGLVRQPDSGIFLQKLADDDYFILGTGTRHSNGEEVVGAGANGIPEKGLLAMNVNPNYEMKDNKKDDVYITWEKEFYSNVIQSKHYFDISEGIVDVFEAENVYLFLGEKDDNLYMSVLTKNELK